LGPTAYSRKRSRAAHTVTSVLANAAVSWITVVFGSSPSGRRPFLLTRPSACPGAGEAQTARRVRVIFSRAHGVDPVRRKPRRSFHHHANCWRFIGDHSQRYVHPSSETVALAMARLDTSNQLALPRAADGKGTDTRTDTVLAPPSVSH
jgi:hypothetical protein